MKSEFWQTLVSILLVLVISGTTITLAFLTQYILETLQ
jgi:hypothetical protein